MFVTTDVSCFEKTDLLYKKKGEDQQNLGDAEAAENNIGVNHQPTKGNLDLSTHEDLGKLG